MSFSLEVDKGALSLFLSSILPTLSATTTHTLDTHTLMLVCETELKLQGMTTALI